MQRLWPRPCRWAFGRRRRWPWRAAGSRPQTGRSMAPRRDRPSRPSRRSIPRGRSTVARPATTQESRCLDRPADNEEFGPDRQQGLVLTESSLTSGAERTRSRSDTVTTAEPSPIAGSVDQRSAGVAAGRRRERAVCAGVWLASGECKAVGGVDGRRAAGYLRSAPPSKRPTALRIRWPLARTAPSRNSSETSTRLRCFTGRSRARRGRTVVQW